MSGAAIAFTAAVGTTTMGPVGWVALGAIGIVGLFGTIIVAVVQDGKTTGAKEKYRAQQRKNKSRGGDFDIKVAEVLVVPVRG